MKEFVIKKWYQWVRLIIIAILLFGVLIFGLNTSGVQMPYLAINIGLILLILLGLMLDFKVNKVLSIVITVLVPILSFYILEGYSQIAIVQMEFQIQILNIIIYALIFILMAGIFGNFARASVVMPVVLMGIALANYYTVQFRQSPILPWDLLSIKTALSVTSNYTFKLPGKILMVSLIFILLSVIGSKIYLEVKSGIKRVCITAVSFVVIMLYSLGIQNVKVGEWFGLDDILFTPNVLYRNNGFMVAFTVNLQYLQIDKPEGYGGEEYTQVLQNYMEEADAFTAIASGNGESENELPNVIVIMNEAFSDLAVLSDFETNQDYMPFIHELQSGTVPNVVSGDLFVSVLGGNTANSEYEFLTGNSMSFLPPGSIAYQQYISERMPSMAWTLKSLADYDTVGMHPYYMSGWDRDEVYPFFGFDESYFKEQMNNVNYLRKYISDQSVVDLIIDEYASENRSENKKFTFAVTMQNHGGYFDAYENFQQEIETIGIEEGYSKSYIDMYLSLMKKSDEAFGNLVNYFESYDEPTIILMFGDHQPGDYVVKSIFDTTEEYPLEVTQQRYVVPFVMWANYDIEDEQVDHISVNYLQTLLFEKAGIPLTGYQQYLSDLRETLPVITANVLIDAQGNYYAPGDKHPYEALIEAYSAYQYNYVFDPGERNDEFFGDHIGAAAEFR